MGRDYHRVMGVSRGTIGAVVTSIVVALGPAAPAAAAYPYPAPTNLTSTGATSSSLSLDWGGVAGAPLYQVKISKSSTMSNASYSWYSASEGTVTGLTSSSKYYVMVKVVDDDHATLSAYSTKITPTTAASSGFAAPQNLTSTGATTSTLSYDWSDVPGAPLYQLKVSASSTMSNPKYFWFSGSSGTATGLTRDTTHYAMVKVVDSGHATLGPYSSKVSARTSADTPPPTGGDDLHVGTFNISGSNTDDNATGDHKVWSQRKPKVVEQIVAEDIDVLGTQEAFWSTGNSLPSGTDQFTDLRNGLNAAGEPFEVTNTNRSVGKGTRILYNTDTVEKLTSGEFKYAHQVSGKTDRYLAWGTFRHKASGTSFFFADTHLSPDSSTVKKQQWQELIPKVKSLNSGSLPVVVVGDFNTSKFGTAAQDMLPAMKSAGFGDVMNQEFEVNPPRSPRAELAVNKWINSFNGYRRNVADFSYEDRRDKVGNGIDWVFATNALRVKLWKVVIDFNPSTLMINGTIPSDHNMLSSIVVLP
jgi:endonuclease/exonuclease/phosphatase family metal-dependent hydrolase